VTGDARLLGLFHLTEAGIREDFATAPIRRFLMAVSAMLLLALATACSTTDAMRTVQPAMLPSGGDADKYAALVIDGSTGRTFYSVNADAQRFPRR
jgi:D-alanyl-D-alanine carboxypeptidase